MDVELLVASNVSTRAVSELEVLAFRFTEELLVSNHVVALEDHPCLPSHLRIEETDLARELPPEVVVQEESVAVIRLDKIDHVALGTTRTAVPLRDAVLVPL